MIRIALAEDQRLLLGAISTLLDLEDDLTVVGRFENGDQARTGFPDLLPDVILTDIEMPGMSGLELAEWLKQD